MHGHVNVKISKYVGVIMFCVEKYDINIITFVGYYEARITFV